MGIDAMWWTINCLISASFILRWLAVFMYACMCISLCMCVCVVDNKLPNIRVFYPYVSCRFYVCMHAHLSLCVCVLSCMCVSVRLSLRASALVCMRPCLVFFFWKGTFINHQEKARNIKREAERCPPNGKTVKTPPKITKICLQFL